MAILLPGVERGSDVIVRNQSVAAQVVAATTRTQVTGTRLQIPEGGLKVGSRIRFTLNMTKTAAGTATSTFDISFGTAGSVSDTARVSFTKPAGTAAADEASVQIEAVVRTVSATGVVVGQFYMVHNLENTGHAVIPTVAVNTVSSAFDTSTGTTAVDPYYVALNLTTGASDAITIQLATAELVL